MELNPFEWGLPWYYYSIGGIILVFSIVFILIYISSWSKEAGPEGVMDHTQTLQQSEVGKENSSKSTISHDSEKYREWKDGD